MKRWERYLAMEREEAWWKKTLRRVRRELGQASLAGEVLHLDEPAENVGPERANRRRGRECWDDPAGGPCRTPGKCGEGVCVRARV